MKAHKKFEHFRLRQDYWLRGHSSEGLKGTFKLEYCHLFILVFFFSVGLRALTYVERIIEHEVQQSGQSCSVYLVRVKQELVHELVEIQKEDKKHDLQ